MFTLVKRHPLITFYILAFLAAWCIKVPVVLSGTGSIFFRLLPSFVPALAALVVVAISTGKEGVTNLLKSAGKVRVSPVWYSIAFVIPGVLEILSAVFAMLFGEKFPGMNFPGIRLLPVLLLALVFALGEELGWRGFAQPQFQQRSTALTASLIVGFLWWFWHIPEVLGTSVSLTQIISLEVWSLVQNLALSILMAWVYNSTDGSVLLVALLHLGNGVLGQIMMIPNGSLASNVYNILLCLIALIVIGTVGPKHLTNKKMKTTPFVPRTLLHVQAD